MKSPSLRGRGLKSAKAPNRYKSKLVALFARAWIEITCRNVFRYRTRSPSLRGRGLKFPHSTCNIYDTVSPSLRGRGLKFSKLGLYIIVTSVALFARAWIEIQTTTKKQEGKPVALFARAWIEMLVSLKLSNVLDVALFARAWIEIY